MTKIKGILKEAGFTGLYALEGRGEKIAFTIAKVLDSVRSLITGLQMIGEAALIPMMDGISISLDLLGMALNVVMLPIKMFVHFIGLARDEAGATRVIFDALGKVIGVLASVGLIKVSLMAIVGAFGFVRAGVTRLILGFTNLTSSMLNFSQMGGRIAVGLNPLNIGLNRTGAAVAVVRAQLGGAGGAITAFGLRMARSLDLATRAAGPLLMLGTLLSMAGEETFSPWIIGIGMLLPMISGLANVIMTRLVPALIAGNLSLGALGAIGLALGALGYYIFSDDDVPSGSKPSPNLNAKPTAMRYTPTGSYEQLMGVQSGGAVTPTTASFSQPTAVYGGATGRAVSEVTHDHSITYNINRMTVNASNPQELGVALKKKSSGRGGFEASMMG